MAEDINKLQDFVRNILDEKNLTYRKVESRSRNQISHSTVSDIVNGRNNNPSPKILRGLARGLGVSEEEIFAFVRGTKPDIETAFNEGLNRNLKRLSPHNRKLAEAQIAAIIDSLVASEPDFDYIDEEN